MATNNFQRGRVEYIENMWVPYSEEAGDEFIGRCQVQLTTATVVPTANGMARIALSTGEGETAQIYGPLAFEVDECTLASLHCRVRTSDADKSSIFIGWTDQIIASEVPMEDEDGTLASAATDAIGILLEGEQDTTWQTVGVQNDVDNAQAAIGATTGDVTLPDAADSNWHSWILELTAADSGTLKVYGEDANGQLVLAATRTGVFRSSVCLAPVISADGRATAYNLDVAEFGWSGGRGAFFD